ncbi:MAG TPA: hypothetical protein VIL25_07470, partial [Vicinamibacterales bacterium]
VDSDANGIDLSAYDVRSGEAVIYRNGGGTSIGGLVDDAVYFIRRLDDGRVVLLNTRDDTDIADLDASVATGSAHRFERIFLDAPAQDSVPDVRMGAAAAIAVGAGRPVSEARIGAGANIVASTVAVTASMDHDSQADADALAIGGVAAAGLAAAGNYSEGRHIAEIGNGATVTAGTISLVASGEENIPFDYAAEAASAAANLGGNVAGSLAVNAARNHTAVRIGEDAVVTVDGRLDLLANLQRIGPLVGDAGRVRSQAFAGEVAFGGGAAVGASVAGTLTLEGDLVEASIGEGAVVTAPAGIDVRAKTNHEFDNLAVGGSLGLLYAGSVGAAFNHTNSEARARVDGSVEIADGTLNVYADTDVTYAPEALGLAAGGAVSIGGSVEANVIANTTSAGIGGGGTIDAGAVNVRARDMSSLSTDTGMLAASGFVAAGGALGANIMANTVEAYIAGATVSTDAGAVDVTATSSYDVDALALAASAAGLVAGVGTFTYNELSNTTSASLRSGAAIASADAVRVRATDTSTVRSDSAGLAASLGAGIGASFALNTVNNVVEAYSDGADATAAAGAFELAATSSNDVDAAALAFSVSGLAGGFATLTSNTLGTRTDASVRTGGTIVAPAVVLRASDDSSLDADGGGLAASLGPGAGGSLALNTVAADVRAGIAAATVTTTSGDVAIEARSSFDVHADALGFTAASLVGGIGTVAINDVANATRAFIDGGATVSSADAVRVVAQDDSSADADAGGLAAV